MKRIRLLSLALFALIALGAFASASAFAEDPTILPTPTAVKPLTFLSSGGIAILQGTNEKNQVKCLTVKNKGEFTTQDSGLVLIDFLDCLVEPGLKCNSPKDEPGVILVLGNIQLVDILQTGTLDLGVWIEPKEELPGTGDLHFTCGGLVTVEVLGSVIGVVDNAKGELLKSLEKFKEVKVLWKQTKGEQEIKECMFLKALCEKGPFELKSSFGKGEELTAEETDVVLNNFSEEVEVHF